MSQPRMAALHVPLEPRVIKLRPIRKILGRCKRGNILCGRVTPLPIARRKRREGGKGERERENEGMGGGKGGETVGRAQGKEREREKSIYTRGACP